MVRALRAFTFIFPALSSALLQNTMPRTAAFLHSAFHGFMNPAQLRGSMQSVNVRKFMCIGSSPTILPRVFAPRSRARGNVRMCSGGSSEDQGEMFDSDSAQPVWVQRKVAVVPPDLESGKIRGGVSKMLYTVVREIEQYRVGIAHLQVQSPDRSIVVGCPSTLTPQEAMVSGASKSVSVSISGGLLALDSAEQDVLIFSTPGMPVKNGPCEVLVTLQGDRGLRGAHPATHTSFQPRAGDEKSAERVQALRSALEALGVDAKEIASSPQFEGTAVRRCFQTFINPRLGRVPNRIETIQEAAERAAKQIMMLEREHRAMLADYLRNSDAARGDASIVDSERRNPLVLVLDNVRSIHNVGSILRVAETAGVQEVVMTGITPHPPHPKLLKTALSSLENVPTRYFESTMEAVLTLRKEGCVILGMETTSRSEVYTKVEYPKPSALILGNELTGVCTDVMEQCDKLIEIPMFGVKNSLNVACAASVATFEVLRQWGTDDDAVAMATEDR